MMMIMITIHHNHNNYNDGSNKSSPSGSGTVLDHGQYDKNKKLWIDRVRNHELFRNPSGVGMMRNAFGINDYSSLMYREPNRCKDWLNIERQKEINYNNRNEEDSKTNNNNNNNNIDMDQQQKLIPFDKKYLREEQAFLAARYALKSGIDLAKAKNLEKAIKHYDVALEWDNKYCDAMVAKAAALCHLNKLDAAEKSIRCAIKLNPNTPNANKYLTIILQQKAGK